MSRFHALLVVRDEVDIIEESLHHLASWADAVHVFDTGSVDGTWEAVRRVAQSSSTVHAVERKPVYFSLSKVRSYLFHRVRDRMQDGDWFLRVDTDERYHIHPPDFVERFMRSGETVAWRQYYDFRLTEEEVSRWKKETKAEQNRPVEDRRRYFTIKRSSEPRLCRYRSTMKWPAHASFPQNAGVVAEQRIPIRHYPHRDPIQMAKRYALRSIQVRAEDSKTDKSLEHHWARENWAEDVVSSDREDLHYWQPGEDLPSVRQNHVAPEPLRVLKRLLYRLPGSILDRWNEPYDVEKSPSQLPAKLQERVKTAYDEIYDAFEARTPASE